jgi:hypothetical protein
MGLSTIDQTRSLLMKKMLLILGVLVAVVALASGMTIAYAKGNGNDVKQGNQPCRNLVLGTVMGTAGNATNGTITLLPRGQNTNQTINVNSDTKYRVWMVPNQSVGFDKLGSGDWVAVCANNGAASLVVLLESPEKPFYLRLEGNVTDVNGNVITGNIKGGGNFTINLTGGGNFTGAAGQPIVLDIGKNGPPAWGISRGPTMKRLMEGIGLWMRNQEGKMWRFGD